MKREENTIRNGKKEFKWLSARCNACHCKVSNTEITSMKKKVIWYCTRKELSIIKIVKQQLDRMNPSNHTLEPLLKKKTKLKEFEIKYSLAIACHNSVKAVYHLPEVVKEYSSKSALEGIRLYRTKCTKQTKQQTLLPSLTTRNLLKS